MPLKLASEEQAKAYLDLASRWISWHPGWGGSGAKPRGAIAEFFANQKGLTIYKYMEGKDKPDLKLDIKKAPKVKPPLIPMEKVEKLREEFKKLGYAVSYRNRDGKQYMTLEQTSECKRNDLSYKGVSNDIDKVCEQVGVTTYFSTSGSWSSRTIRLNQEERCLS